MSSPDLRSSIVVRAPQANESVSSNNIEGLKTKTKEDSEHSALFHGLGKSRHTHAKDGEERNEDRTKDKNGKHRKRSSGQDKERRPHKKKSKTEKHRSRSSSPERVPAPNLHSEITWANELEMGELENDSPEEVDIIELHSRITSVVNKPTLAVDSSNEVFTPNKQ